MPRRRRPEEEGMMPQPDRPIAGGAPPDVPGIGVPPGELDQPGQVPRPMGEPAEGPPMPPPGMGEPGMEAPEGDPLSPETDPGEDVAPPEAVLPERATVMEMRGDTVVIQDDNGQMLRLPVDVFPFVPTEGMRLAQAVVVESTEDAIVAQVDGETVEIPADEVTMPFDVGDFFWMPEPPAGPEDLRDEAPEEMPEMPEEMPEAEEIEPALEQYMLPEEEMEEERRRRR